MISLTSPVETTAHGWPASIKLGLLCLATLLLFRVEDLALQGAFLAALLVLYSLPGRTFLKVGLRRLFILWPFLLLVLLWHLAIWQVAEGLLIGSRMVVAVGMANLVTMTTKLSDMLAFIEKLCAPLRLFGVKTSTIALAMALVIRFVPVLVQKGEVLRLSWRARSRRRPGWRLVLPFAIAAIDDAEQVAEALRARGGS